MRHHTQCIWCLFYYDHFTPETEREHLRTCEEFQSQPVAVVRDGKTFVQLPGFEHVLVERESK